MTATTTAAAKTTKAAREIITPAFADGATVRAKVFELLAANPKGVTGREVKLALGLTGVPNLLKDEGVTETPRIRRFTREGVRGVLYALTKAGRKDLKAGKVDTNAAPVSVGKDWADEV